MKERNLVRVYECDEAVQWPDAWPKIPANNYRFGSKLVEEDGKKVWVEGTEADCRKTLKRYGHTDAEVNTIVSRRLSAPFGDCTADHRGGCTNNHCDAPLVCLHYQDLQDSFDSCICSFH